MPYLTTSPCVLAWSQSGSLDHRYEGEVIPWLSDEQRDRFLKAGLVSDLSVESSVKPKHTAKVADWVDFAVSQGADREEAESLTKQELVDLYS